MVTRHVIEEGVAEKTCRMPQAEKESGKPIEDIVKELCERRALLEDAAAELGIDQTSLCVWLMRLGFEERWVKLEPELEQEETSS